MSEHLSAAVCVVGAGPVGGTLACRLASAGISTIVVDRAALPPMEHPACDGRVGRRASSLFLHFDHREAGSDSGAFGWMVEARSLRVALNAHMHTLPALRVFAPAAADVERREDGASVR